MILVSKGFRHGIAFPGNPDLSRTSALVDPNVSVRGTVATRILNDAGTQHFQGKNPRSYGAPAKARVTGVTYRG